MSCFFIVNGDFIVLIILYGDFVVKSPHEVVVIVIVIVVVVVVVVEVEVEVEVEVVVVRSGSLGCAPSAPPGPSGPPVVR